MRKGDRREIAGAVIDVFWPETIIEEVRNRQYNEAQLARHSDYHLPITIYLEPDMVASHIPFHLVPKIQ